MKIEQGLALRGSISSIPEPCNQTQHMQAFYTSCYGERGAGERLPKVLKNPQDLEGMTNTNDSPAESRRSILQRLSGQTNLGEQDVVLDLGAGKQITETELLAGILGTTVPPFKIITIDIANILYNQLLVPTYFPQQTNYPHIIADGSQLPLKSASISAAISNMALDFMPKEAKKELFRVLKNGAPAFLNLHHPSKIPGDLDESIARLTAQMTAKLRARGHPSPTQERRLANLNHDRYLRDNKILFETEERIQKEFEESGFKIDMIGEKTNGKDTWWEVDLVKPFTHSLIIFERGNSGANPKPKKESAKPTWKRLHEIESRLRRLNRKAANLTSQEKTERMRLIVEQSNIRNSRITVR